LKGVWGYKLGVCTRFNFMFCHHILRLRLVEFLWNSTLCQVSHTTQETRHTSHVTRHTSHVTRHTSHVTRHTSHVTITCSVRLSARFTCVSHERLRVLMLRIHALVAKVQCLDVNGPSMCSQGLRFFATDLGLQAARSSPPVPTAVQRFEP